MNATGNDEDLLNFDEEFKRLIKSIEINIDYGPNKKPRVDYEYNLNYGNIYYDDCDETPLIEMTQQERINIIEACECINIKSVVGIKFEGLKGYYYNFCPYCSAENNKTPSKSFSFTECYNCKKSFKNY